MSQLDKIFRKFKTSKGSCADGIANHILKIGLLACQNHFVTFDLCWKIARVVPNFQKWSKQ